MTVKKITDPAEIQENNIPPEATKANVIESKVTKYEIPLKANENTENQNSDSFIENFNQELFEETDNTEEENSLDNFLNQLEVLSGKSLNARIMRMPDAADDVFDYPCYENKFLGLIPFHAENAISIFPRIQKLNRNSGGRFHIRITLFGKDTGITLENFFIENPEKKEETAITPQATGGNEFALIINEMREDRKLLIQQINRSQQAQQSQPSELEKMMQQLVLLQMQKLISGDNNGSNSIIENTIAQVMGSVAIVDKLGDALANKIGSGNESTEQTTGQILLNGVISKLDNPDNFQAALNVVNNLGTRLSNTVDNLVVPTEKIKAKTEQLKAEAELDYIDPEETEETENAEPTEEQIAMHDAIKIIVDELESDNPINAENERLQFLKMEYPQYAPQVEQLCKTMEFETVLNLLGNLAGDVLIPYLDVPATQTQRILVWNKEKGVRMKQRLQEFYNYSRSI